MLVRVQRSEASKRFNRWCITFEIYTTLRPNCIQKITSGEIRRFCLVSIHP
jgi:hypothetical protein